jgi:DNA-binding MarR family transcriptional regulator
VAYLNFELAPWAMAERIYALRTARPECAGGRERLHFWHLRGHNADLSVLRPQLETELARQQFGLIILDPAYKLLGNRDENANGEIADLMNQFEALAQKTGAAIVIAHHFAKGDSSAKTSIDRMSGAGAWARDPDSLFILSPHEEDRCFTVSPTLRNLPMMPEFVVEWDFPLMKLAKDLNPEALRRPQSKNKLCSDKEFMDAVLDGSGKTYGRIVEDGRSLLNMSTSTAERALKRLKTAGLVNFSGGLYWRTVNSVTSLKE